MKSILIFFLVSVYVDGGKIDKMEKKIEKILEKQGILKESIKELKVGIYNVCHAEKRTKRSIILLLRLVRFSA